MEEARLWRSEMAANISVCRTLLELPMLHFPKFKNCCEALARVVPIFSTQPAAPQNYAVRRRRSYSLYVEVRKLGNAFFL